MGSWLDSLSCGFANNIMKSFKLFYGLVFYKNFFKMEPFLSVFSYLSGCFFIFEIRLNPDKEKV